MCIVGDFESYGTLHGDAYTSTKDELVLTPGWRDQAGSYKLNRLSDVDLSEGNSFTVFWDFTIDFTNY